MCITIEIRWKGYFRSLRTFMSHAIKKESIVCKLDAINGLFVCIYTVVKPYPLNFRMSFISAESKIY